MPSRSSICRRALTSKSRWSRDDRTDRQEARHDARLRRGGRGGAGNGDRGGAPSRGGGGRGTEGARVRGGGAPAHPARTGGARGRGGGPETHGNTRHRKPGSIAPGTDPSRIIKGKRMPGHMGARRFTELGLRVVKVDAERNLLFVRGAVPGPMNGLLTIRKQGGRSRHD